jgi:hypothetical protein
MSRFIKQIVSIGLILSLGSVVTSSPVKAKELSDKELKRQIALVKKQIPKGEEYRCPQYNHLIKEEGLPVQIFSYIMWRESRCQPKVIGWNYKSGKSHRDCKLAPTNIYKKCGAVRSYDSGLLQINSSWTTVTQNICGERWGDMTVLLKVKCNIKVAKFIFYHGGGFSNWGFKV